LKQVKAASFTNIGQSCGTCLPFEYVPPAEVDVLLLTWAGCAAAQGSWLPQQVAIAAGDQGDSQVTHNMTSDCFEPQDALSRKLITWTPILIKMFFFA